MKYLILLGFVVVIAAAAPPTLPAEALEKLKGIGKSCVEESGVVEDVLEKIRSHDFDFKDDKGKCHMKCFCVKSGICNEDFTINPTKLKESKPYLPEEKVNEFVPICNEIKEENDCDTVAHRIKCMMDKIPEGKEHKIEFF